jgi:hypothetical protein
MNINFLKKTYLKMFGTFIRDSKKAIKIEKKENRKQKRKASVARPNTPAWVVWRGLPATLVGVGDPLAHRTNLIVFGIL